MALFQPLQPLDSSFTSEYERCWPWLEATLSAEGYGFGDVLTLCAKGEAQLWPFDGAAALTQLLDCPTGRAVRVWAAGGNREYLEAAQDSLEEWARGAGAARLEIVGRRGWLRALKGYREVATIMTRDLNNG